MVQPTSTAAALFGRSAAAPRHRVELLRAAEELERVIAALARDPAWLTQVARRLAALRSALTEHIVATEGSDGLYAELLGYAPRLNRGVAGLVAEHGALLVAVDALARQVHRPHVSPEIIRDAGEELLADLALHRQRGADLIYEAYATDIGGET
jgi:hypothetical protein